MAAPSHAVCEVTSRDLGDVALRAELGEALELGVAESDAAGAVQHRDRRRRGTARLDGRLYCASRLQILWERHPVADNRGLEGDDCFAIVQGRAHRWMDLERWRWRRGERE